MKLKKSIVSMLSIISILTSINVISFADEKEDKSSFVTAENAQELSKEVDADLVDYLYNYEDVNYNFSDDVDVNKLVAFVNKTKVESGEKAEDRKESKEKNKSNAKTNNETKKKDDRKNDNKDDKNKEVFNFQTASFERGDYKAEWSQNNIYQDSSIDRERYKPTVLKEKEEEDFSTDFETSQRLYNEQEKKRQEEKRRKEEAKRQAQASQSSGSGISSNQYQMNVSNINSAPTAMRSYNQSEIDSIDDSTIGGKVARESFKYLGGRYVWGAAQLGVAVDCSGFTSQLYKKFGVNIPRTSYLQRFIGKRITDVKDAQPGDIVCFNGHVGIYIGNGNMIHASSPSTGIIKTKINYGARPICFVRPY